ncbi:hypothetical protein CCUG63695_02154 [Mycobacteroides franklinii]|uniref:Uncharacterized protein n=1 Tax=Mycobacteroides franklinii TaxID=948102 RepID=A0A4R8R856_9MYCO|nr:hypothetical protein CCUG64054_02227 [Mycobacteroides franklinii]TDZ52334.1 hypothetical protein CCUG63697_00812 [Mycobacteroides franklinii]TDZ55741.1 hypothetical protein CCUG63696_02229 [Mycobacteroides franklinii]TDZ62682.1 hypothetical protein CCUG63695_02154 [Mycobacteroides franklinii]TDZ69079.1 hypothetical protein CCUG64056_02227 [Mycobacteroides franklinii]
MRNFSAATGSPASIHRVTDSTDARGPGAGARDVVVVVLEVVVEVVVVVDVDAVDEELVDVAEDEVEGVCCRCGAHPATSKIRANTLQTRTR